MDVKLLRECPILTGIQGRADFFDQNYLDIDEFFWDFIRGHDFFLSVLRRGHDFFRSVFRRGHDFFRPIFRRGHDFFVRFSDGVMTFLVGFPTGS